MRKWYKIFLVSQSQSTVMQNQSNWKITFDTEIILPLDTVISIFLSSIQGLPGYTSEIFFFGAEGGMEGDVPCLQVFN